MRFLMFINLLLLSASTLAMTDSTRVKHRKYLIGFSIGYTNTTLSGTEINLRTRSPDAFMEAKQGFDIAFTYKMEPSDFLVLKSGMGLVSNRSYSRNSGSVYPLEAELKFISIPVLVGFQPVNLRNSQNFNLYFESGLSINLDAGSSDNIGPGLHPDNTVDRKMVVPAFVLSGNFEIKITDKVLFTLNYKHSKHLADYFSRVYKVYDITTKEYIYYHYAYRVESNHLTVGMLFFSRK